MADWSSTDVEAWSSEITVLSDSRITQSSNTCSPKTLSITARNLAALLGRLSSSSELCVLRISHSPISILRSRSGGPRSRRDRRWTCFRKGYAFQIARLGLAPILRHRCNPCIKVTLTIQRLVLSGSANYRSS